MTFDTNYQHFMQTVDGLTPEQKEKLERIKENTDMLILAILKLLDEKDKGV